MSTLITAGVIGLFGGIFLIWRARKAERDALIVERQKDILAGEKQADIDEKEIKDRAEAARDSAPPDFTTFR